MLLFKFLPSGKLDDIDKVFGQSLNTNGEKYITQLFLYGWQLLFSLKFCDQNLSDNLYLYSILLALYTNTGTSFSTKVYTILIFLTTFPR